MIPQAYPVGTARHLEYAEQGVRVDTVHNFLFHNGHPGFYRVPGGGARGLTVSEVKRNTPASKQGVQPGMVVTSVTINGNVHPCADSEEFLNAMRETNAAEYTITMTRPATLGPYRIAADDGMSACERCCNSYEQGLTYACDTVGKGVALLLCFHICVRSVGPEGETDYKRPSRGFTCFVCMVLVILLVVIISYAVEEGDTPAFSTGPNS